MSEDLKPADVQRIVSTFKEVITEPAANVAATSEDLVFLQDYLDNGLLSKKITNLLADREQKRHAEEIAKALEITRLELEKRGDSEVDKKYQMSQSSSSYEVTEDSGSDSEEDEEEEEVYIPTSNEPRTDYLSFIGSGDSFLLLEKKPFPLDYAVQNERLSYPLGVVYDETTEDWLISDRDNNKILRVNVARNNSSVTDATPMKNPSAIIIYEEGKVVAVLCSEDRRRQFTIYLYHYYKNKIRRFASYLDEMYDMRHQMRGLAKSVGNNLISLDLIYNGPKRLRIFNKEVGARAFEMKGATNPSFVATHNTTVAVSDLGVNKVFIYELDDRDWKNVQFMPTKIIDSTPLPMDKLANESGFAFVSGMQFDKNGFLLIGDAKGHSIKLYDTEYTFLHRVSSDFALPFMSSFYVNSAGDMMLLDVHAPQKLSWATLKSVGEILPWIPLMNTNSNGPRRVAFQNNNFRRGGLGSVRN